MNIAVALFGFLLLLGIVSYFSKNRKAIAWKQVGLGIGLQVILAVLILQVPGIKNGFQKISDGVEWFLSFGDHGARFLFGPLMDTSLPVTVEGEAGVVEGVASLGAIVILKILPTMIFVSSAMSVLYHLGILQRVVWLFAFVVRFVLKVSGAEALACTANVFLGLTEAPLLIRPYLNGMTRSEMMAVMVGGFATISGSMMAIYSQLFNVELSHLLAASILNAPAALYLTKIYLPETEIPKTLGGATFNVEKENVNVIDAASSGASLGLKLALNVGAMLLAFSAGIHLIDSLMGEVSGIFLAEKDVLSLGKVLGWIFMPLAWLLGVPAADCPEVGSLLGTKVVLNEYFAYQALTEVKASISNSSYTIATFALCGFANLGTMAILMGGLGGLVPDRRKEIAQQAFRAMLLGGLANCLTATIAGIVLSLPF